MNIKVLLLPSQLTFFYFLNFISHCFFVFWGLVFFYKTILFSLEEWKEEGKK